MLGESTPSKQRENRKTLIQESESESERAQRRAPTRARQQPEKSIDEEAAELRAKLLQEEAQGNG